MTKQTDLGGSFSLAGTSMSLQRIGYGAMQLAGPQVYGPPRDRNAAIAVLREAVAAGVNHIDTSDYYGPHITNQIIKQALHPYPEGLVLVTKVGARRPEDKSWVHALSRQELIDAVHDNLRNLGLDAMDVVNLRVGGAMGPSEGSIEEPLTVLAELKLQGLIRHLGVSNVTRQQFAEAQAITEIACVQNSYNVAHRQDDDFIDDLARRGVAYVPFFPRRVHSVAVVGAGCGRGGPRSYADASSTGVATAALAQHPVDSGYIFCRASSRESRSGDAANSIRDHYQS